MKIDSYLCITFAGPVGCSKSPIAYYLSYKFSLPIFNNDTIRTEIIEDLNKFDQEEYQKRRDNRLNNLLKQKMSFIYDASIDRYWQELKEKLVENDYQWFIISIDLSKDLLSNLYRTKNYHESLKRIDSLIQDHEQFLKKYRSEINLNITDDKFPDRLEICYQALKDLVQHSC